MTKAQESEAAWVKQCELWLKQDWFCKYCGFFLPGDPPTFRYGFHAGDIHCKMCDTPLFYWLTISPCTRKCQKSRDPKKGYYSFMLSIA